MITGVWLSPPDQFDNRETIAVQFDEEQLLLWVDGSTVDEIDEIPGDWEELIPAGRLTDLIDKWEQEIVRVEAQVPHIVELDDRARHRALGSQAAALKQLRTCLADLAKAMHSDGQK